MAASDLQKMLEKVVNANAHLGMPYFILVVVKNHYQGPSAVSESQGIQTTEVQLPDKMIHNRIIAPLLRPPAVRQLGSMLWRVDNRIGEMKLMYAEAADWPTVLENSDNAGQAIAGSGVPVVWN